VTTEVPFCPIPIDQTDARYAYGPDSFVHEGVPTGTVTEHEWNQSATYPGTSRRFWVYVPAQYDASEPASLMVFQDGEWNLDPLGDVRATTVLDNLIHRGDLPATVGVFVDAGVLAGAEVADGGRNRQRNVEYDAFDDRYVSFLLDEVLPEVTKHWSITEDPDRRGLFGVSSGGNCALTAAWLRPDAFGRVVCCLSSFAQLPDGNIYPALISQTPRKPLRIFMQAAHRDLGWNEPEDNWLADNLRVAAALAEADYDFRLVLGDGGHDPNHAGVLLPDALRWLFGPAG
jgi:enterochelin esterase family protein